MEHFFAEIYGHFDFDDVYSMMVKEAPETARFVEIGAYLGRSTAFLSVEIVNSNKDIKLDIIDTWKGSDSSEYHEDKWGHDMTVKDDYFEIFTKNMESVKDRYRAVVMDSVEAAKLYEDGSLDFVFIDGAHDYKYVKADIEAWLPKIKKNGYLGGHDYVSGQHDEVIRAVTETFKEDFSIYRYSWLHKVK